MSTQSRRHSSKERSTSRSPPPLGLGPSPHPPLLESELPAILTDRVRPFLSAFFSSSQINEPILDEFVRSVQLWPQLISTIFQSPARKAFPPRKTWECVLAKQLIRKMDEFGMEPSDVLYELIGASMTSPPLRDEAGEYFYRIFADLFSSDFTRAPYLVLKETEQQIYRGTTGLSCWQASFVLSNFLFHQCLRCSSIFPSHRFSHAIELGAGCGLSGIAFASAHATASVTLTDAHPLVIRRLHENAALNFVGDWEGKKGSIEVARLDWTDWRAEELPEADLILAADVVYDPSLFPFFASLLHNLLNNRTTTTDHRATALIACTVRDPSTHSKFLQSIEQKGISLRAEYQCLTKRTENGSVQIGFARRSRSFSDQPKNETELTQIFCWFDPLVPFDLENNPHNFPTMIFEFVCSSD